jgi:phenylacetic acid degradation operon negative regulatory protein
LRGDDSPPLAYYFRQRFWLVHEYRFFPFHDPYLPAELLPRKWPGDAAFELFQNYHTLLEDKANVYVDEILARAPRMRD